eukprot:1158638-Pelagomonas_calceolata.AAC.3
MEGIGPAASACLVSFDVRKRQLQCPHPGAARRSGSRRNMAKSAGGASSYRLPAGQYGGKWVLMHASKDHDNVVPSSHWMQPGCGDIKAMHANAMTRYFSHSLIDFCALVNRKLLNQLGRDGSMDPVEKLQDPFVWAGGPQTVRRGESALGYKCAHAVVANSAFCPLHQKPSELGIPDKRCCWFCMPSSGLDCRLAGSGQELPAKSFQKICLAPATASHAPLTLQGCLKLLYGGSSQSLRAWGGVGGWAARCELYLMEANLGAHAP